MFREVRGLLPVESGTVGSRLLDVLFRNAGMEVDDVVSRLSTGLASLEDCAVDVETGSAVSARPVMDRGSSRPDAMSAEYRQASIDWCLGGHAVGSHDCLPKFHDLHGNAGQNNRYQGSVLRIKGRRIIQQGLPDRVKCEGWLDEQGRILGDVVLTEYVPWRRHVV